MAYSNVEDYYDYHYNYRQQNAERLAEQKRLAGNLAKAEGIIAYGGKCNCCGESTVEFLTIDHINGRDYEVIKMTGKKLWLWLKARKFPTDNYQLLCFNCNCAKGIYGRCPHVK